MTAPAPTPPAPTPPAPPAPTPPAAPPAPPAPTPPAVPKEEVKDLPDWAQTIIAAARKDAGDARVAAKTAETTLVEKLMVALGQKPDPKTDPAALAAQIADSQAAAKTAAVKLAVYQGASKHAGDPDALLDSTAFMAGLAGLDPTAGDFTAKVEAAIKTATAANVKFKTGPAAAATSGAQFTGGPGEAGKTRPTSLGAAVTAAYKQ